MLRISLWLALALFPLFTSAQGAKVFGGYIAYRFHISPDSIPMPHVKVPKMTTEMDQGTLEIWVDSLHVRFKMAKANGEVLDERILDYQKRKVYSIHQLLKTYTTTALEKTGLYKPLGMVRAGQPDSLICGQNCTLYGREANPGVLPEFKALWLAQDWILPPSACDSTHAKLFSLSTQLPLAFRSSKVREYYEEGQPPRIAASHTTWVVAEKFEVRPLKPEEYQPPSAYREIK